MCSSAARPVTVTHRCGRTPKAPPSSATELARRPRESPATRMCTTPVPGVITTTPTEPLPKAPVGVGRRDVVAVVGELRFASSTRRPRTQAWSACHRHRLLAPVAGGSWSTGTVWSRTRAPSPGWTRPRKSSPTAVRPLRWPVRAAPWTPRSALWASGSSPLPGRRRPVTRHARHGPQRSSSWPGDHGGHAPLTIGAQAPGRGRRRRMSTAEPRTTGPTGDYGVITRAAGVVSSPGENTRLVYAAASCSRD